MLCLFERLWGLYENSGRSTQQRKAADHTAPGTQLHPQLVGISYAVDYAPLRPAAMEAPLLFLAHFPTAPMEIPAPLHRGAVDALSPPPKIPRAGWIELERWRASGQHQGMCATSFLQSCAASLS